MLTSLQHFDNTQVKSREQKDHISFLFKDLWPAGKSCAITICLCAHLFGVLVKYVLKHWVDFNETFNKSSLGWNLQLIDFEANLIKDGHHSKAILSKTMTQSILEIQSWNLLW